MKKKNIYLLSVLVFIALVAAIIIKNHSKEKEREEKVYTLLPRKGAAAKSQEWADVQKKANDLQAALKLNPYDKKASLKLAALFIQEARESGNYMYYDVAAMKQVNGVLALDSLDFNALVFKSLIYMSQHHFAEGLATAEKAKNINPYNAYVYGLLVDGNVEMGMYDSAVASADRMVAIRPDLTSYSRVSYLREIFGDYPGAIKAMRMAVDAGGRGDEHTEWTRVQLANLYEKTADFKSADTLYQFSLSVRPEYPFALAGLARIAMASNDYTKAITYLEQANNLVTDNNLKDELGDAYKAAGQKQKADAMANAVIEELSKDAQAGNNDESIGHYGDRELAYAYLKVNQVDKALEHAMLEYNRRPENIDVNETVAWVYYHKGDYARALPYIQTALKTHSKNPVLLCRAALIYYKAGNKEMAKSLMATTSIANPYIDSSLKMETSSVMQQL